VIAWIVRIGAGLLLALVLLAGALLWREADNEIRILCGLFPPGTPRAEVDRTLATGHFLQAREAAGADRTVTIVFDSPWNLWTRRCAVTLEDGAVVASVPVRP
jgi:hypothetical protein